MIYGISGIEHEAVASQIPNAVYYDLNSPIRDIVNALFGWKSQSTREQIIDVESISNESCKAIYDLYLLERNANEDIIDFLRMMPIEFNMGRGKYITTQYSAYEIFRHKILNESDVLGMIPLDTDIDISISVQSEMEYEYVDWNEGTVIHVGHMPPTGIESLLIINDPADIDKELKQWFYGTTTSVM